MSRTEISPGYWRCDSTITTEREGPGFQRPGSGPPVLYDTRVCGQHYGEASATPSNLGLCRCNTGAIGLCSECQRPVCGSHSGLWDGQRLCDEHYEVRAAAKRTADARAKWERDRAREAKRKAEEQEAARKAAELIAAEMRAQDEVIRVVEQLQSRGCPGSKKEKISGPRSWGRSGWRRRTWLLHTAWSYDNYECRSSSASYWVTNHLEFFDNRGHNIRGIELLRYAPTERTQLSPFNVESIPELRWTGILRTLKGHL